MESTAAILTMMNEFIAGISLIPAFLVGGYFVLTVITGIKRGSGL